MHPATLTSVLCRTELNRGQITLLKLLYERDEPVGRKELAKTLRGDIREDYERSFVGVLGAFGKRINATDEVHGTPGIDAFLKKQRINGETHYQLRPEAREAIENIPTLLEKFDNTWSELLEPDTTIDAENLVPVTE